MSASLKQVFAVHKRCGENLPDDVAVLAAPGSRRSVHSTSGHGDYLLEPGPALAPRAFGGTLQLLRNKEEAPCVLQEGVKHPTKSCPHSHKGLELRK